MPERHVLEMRRTFDAPAERVFEAFSNPELLREWATPREHRTERVEQDFRIGGRYRREIRFPDGSLHVLTGEYLEIAPPRRLVYSYAWETLPGPATRVEIELVERAGSTELRLVHSGFADGQFAADHEQGWVECFDGLEALVTRVAP